MKAPTKKKVVKNFKEEKLGLTCKWRGCDFGDSDDVTEFAKHVMGHAGEEEKDVCLWENCGEEEFEEDIHLSRHLSFHAHHEKMLAHGRNFVQLRKLPACLKEKKAWDWPCDTPSVCLWEHCNSVFNDVVTFYAHVHWHALMNPRGNTLDEPLRCLWSGCTATCKSVYKLREHARAHSEEKALACPGCEMTFAGRTKLQDHLQRQDDKCAEFRCPHCFKAFPSQRICRDHLRRHINYYRCNICSVTFATPAAIANHHRYRHQTDRPFKCPVEGCLYAGKRRHDVARHMATHSSTKSFECPADGCEERFKSKDRLDHHLRQVHEVGEKRKYVCHLCDGKWTRGAHLTKHLIKQHHIYMPDTHNRYTYVKGEDGFYRMQLVRFEAVADQTAAEPSDQPLPFEEAERSEEGENDDQDDGALAVDESAATKQVSASRSDEEGRAEPMTVSHDLLTPKMEFEEATPLQGGDADADVDAHMNDENGDLEAYVEDGEVLILHSRPLREGDELAFEFLPDACGGSADDGHRSRTRIRILSPDHAS